MASSSVASAVHELYGRLGGTGKPQRGEWTVVAAVVLEDPLGALSVLALGTGTKCLPASAVAADRQGSRLHDSHAEVCARRAFRLFLLSQLRLETNQQGASLFRRLAPRRFELRRGDKLHFYTSQPPCGDAAIFAGQEQGAELGPAVAVPAAAQGEDSQTPPSKRPRSVSVEESNAGECREQTVIQPGSLTAISNPHQLGSRPTDVASGKRTGARPAIVAEASAEAEHGGAAVIPGLLRAKPGRGERTCCMSCSDKLARWTALGLQGALISLLIPEPLVPTTITCGRPCCLQALRRSLRLQPDYSSLPVLSESAIEFEAGIGSRSCSNSILWHAGYATIDAGRLATPLPKHEAINGQSGLRLGANKTCTSPKVRSAACKANFGAEFLRLYADMPSDLAAALPSSAPGGNAVEEESAFGEQGCHDERTVELRAQNGLNAGDIGMAVHIQPTVVEPLPMAYDPVGPDSCADGSVEGETPRVTASPADGTSYTVARSACANESGGIVALSALTYREIKALSREYQARKAALMGRPEFRGWMRAPASCESFVVNVGERS